MDCIGITYRHLVNHIVPGPHSASYFAPFVFLPAALLIPPSILSHRTSCIIFLPIITASLIHAWQVMGAVDVISVNGLFWSFYLIGAKDPRTEFVRLVKRSSKDKHFTSAPVTGDTKSSGGSAASPLIVHGGAVYDEVPYPERLLPRLPWVGTLLISLRMTDWKINDPAHDRRQPGATSGKSHAQFIAFAIARSILGYVLVDLTATVTAADPYFHDLGLPLISNPLPLPLTSKLAAAIAPQSSPLSLRTLPWLLQYLYSLPLSAAALRSLVVGTQAWALISQQYYAPMLIPVSLHAFGFWPDTWAPHLWQPNFGPAISILDRGIRGFWSTYWHQTMRFVCGGVGPGIIEVLIPKQEAAGGKSNEGNDTRPTGQEKRVRAHKIRYSTLEYFLLTVIAFGISGVIHMGLVPRAPLHADVSANRIRLYVGGFFWLQPVGMVVEKIVAGVLSSTVSARFRAARAGMIAERALYAAWVTIWACICFPLLAEAGRQLGYFRGYPVPWSLVQWLSTGDGLTWQCLR